MADRHYRPRSQYTEWELDEAKLRDLEADLATIDRDGKAGPEWDAYRKELKAQIKILKEKQK